MDFFIGHLIGDYLLQNDWQAMNKKAPSFKGFCACTVHCILYTAAVVLCTGWFKPWQIALVYLSHFPIDRTYIVAWYMRKLGSFKRVMDGQDMFHKTWAYLLVDNTVHLVLLWGISKL